MRRTWRDDARKLMRTEEWMSNPKKRVTLIAHLAERAEHEGWRLGAGFDRKIQDQAFQWGKCPGQYQGLRRAEEVVEGLPVTFRIRRMITKQIRALARSVERYKLGICNEACCILPAGHAGEHSDQGGNVWPIEGAGETIAEP